MNVVRRVLAAVVVMGVCCGVPAAKAQIPVTDVASLVQQVQQVAAWAQQYTQMVDQITNQVREIAQLKATFDAMTGDRGMAALLNGPLDQIARRYLPADVNQILDLYNGTIVPGYSALSSRIQALRSSISTLPPGYFPSGSQLEGQLNGVLDALGAQRVIAEQAYGAVTARTTNVENLIATIASATDPAAIAQLQARIQAEQVLAQNEANRIALLQYQQVTQQREAELRQSQAYAQANRVDLGGIVFPATRVTR